MNDFDTTGKPPYGERVRDKLMVRAGLRGGGFAMQAGAGGVNLEPQYEKTLIRAHLAEADVEILDEDNRELAQQLKIQKAIGENLARMVAWYQEKTGIEHSGAAGALIVTCKRCGRQVDESTIMDHLLEHVRKG